jgi:hypothetical protein
MGDDNKDCLVESARVLVRECAGIETDVNYFVTYRIPTRGTKYAFLQKYQDFGDVQVFAAL